jgi:hypothetical protein
MANKTSKNVRRAWCVALGVASLALGPGCSSEPYRYVKVSGDLKYEDGSPIEGESVSLIFKPQVEPIDEKTHPKEGIAYTEEDGTFAAVTSHKFEDGIIAGTHHVLVIATGSDGQSLVPPEYTDANKTPLKVHTDDQPFSFRVPRRTP